MGDIWHKGNLSGTVGLAWESEWEVFVRSFVVNDGFFGDVGTVNSVPATPALELTSGDVL